jgi:exosortase family protein XrtF
VKQLLLKYKSVVRFVLLFLGTYLVLSFLYAQYLSISQASSNSPDYVTYAVARQTSAVLNVLGYQATIEPKDNLPVLKLNVEGVYLAQIIEGCNALSVIILFIAFVVAFAAGFKKTIMFLLAGSVLIYGINILRIVILSIALYEYPQYEEILHGVVFPAIIYGIVFLLWVLWVRQLKPEIPQAHA